MNNIEQIANQFDFKLTGLRKDILEFFLKTNRPLKAYEILAKIKAIRANAQPPTVYRVLDFLVKNGALHRLDSCNAYSLCALPHDHEHSKEIEVLFICQLCSKIIEFSDIVLTAFFHKIQTEKSLYIKSQQIELQGVCHQCLNP